VLLVPLLRIVQVFPSVDVIIVPELPTAVQILGYIPISPAHPQKENRFILKGWGIKLRVLGWIFYLFYNS
jgi:hypothetical protein